ncbi:MAG TPA: aminofutalosine synthase MqnE [Phycisphaerae bacterium]|nr:aminofutalosine synthase MqnE [Phycisphaerae bacterium]
MSDRSGSSEVPPRVSAADLHTRHAQLLSDRLAAIEGKVAAGERLSRDDGLALFEATDLLAVGALADRVRQAKHGLATWYCANTHVNYTNCCVNQCPLCAFWADPQDERGYLLTIDEILDRVAPDVEAGATEIHIVGGLHPDVGLDFFLDMLGRLHEAFPEVCLQALTAVEVAYAAKQSGLPVADVLARLKAAGLSGLPGGGAEIFDPAVRQRICPNKISGAEWIDVQRQAHGLGIPTNATMLYGHVESPAHRVDHLLALRDLQDETGGLAAFIPLPFHPKGTGFADLPGPTAVDDLKTMAAARLLLDNVPHMKAFWIMLGPDLAQVALRFGADDVDGTVIREEITHAAGARTPERLTIADLVALVRGAGCEPVERDTLYRRIERGRELRQWERVPA